MIIILMNTTISISTDLRDEINQFGHKGETYNDILTRFMTVVKEEQIRKFLLDPSDCLTADEFRKEIDKW